MSLHNGTSDKFDKTDDTSVGVEETALDKDSGNDSSVEDAFFGFPKGPNVVVERIDVSPYLGRKPKPKAKPAATQKGILKKSVYLDQFSMRCAVNIFRDDLGMLKEAVSKHSEHKTCTDMNGITCKICAKVYPSKKKLHNHQNNKHMIVYKANDGRPKKRVSFSDNVIVHEVKEYHKCRKCPKIFESYKVLKLHMKQIHKKRKCYICNYCSKRFADRMFFKVHIKLHCDVCGLLLANKSEYVNHRRNVCRVLKTYKCKTCDDTFYKIMDVKDHSYSHMDGVLVCDICKDQCKSLCALAHHISFLHSEKRPTSLYTMRNLGSERLYLCNFCEESSVEKDVIENHTGLLPDLNNRVMTGYKDYYFCDHCFLKFDTEPDMVQHKWTHFLKTSDNSQIRQGSDEPKKKEFKKFFNISEEVPAHFQPKVVVTKLKINEKVLTETQLPIDVNCLDLSKGNLKKPLVDPKSKKTIISRHQCENCGKYFSSNYCLGRHIATQHGDYESLRCNVCEEVFVWPSLLRSHKCIRVHIPDVLPFDDARPEIQFDNTPQSKYTNGFTEITNGFDDLGIINDNDDYMNNVDFDIPAPIVEIQESDAAFIPAAPVTSNGNIPSTLNQILLGGTAPNSNYKITLQEVPIEF